MKKILVVFSFSALILTVLAPLLFYNGKITLEANKLMMNSATAVWFLSALFWGEKKRE